MSIWVHFYTETLPRSATGNSGHSLVSSCRQSMFVSRYTHVDNGSIIYSGTSSASVPVFAYKSLLDQFWNFHQMSKLQSDARHGRLLFATEQIP